MCESYAKMFDALDRLPTDEYLTLGSLLSKAMVEGPRATSHFLTVMAIELMEPDWQQDYCQHTETASILTADIVRVFCKSCRYVSFHFLSGLSGEVARSRFARTSEHRGVIEHSKTS